MRRPALAVILVATLAFGACQSAGQNVAMVSQPQGIEGRWAAVGGPVAYNADFANGQFTSVESATNGVLARGTYSSLGPGQINILYTSTTRNQQISANCNQVATNRLSCATSTGNRFDLARA